MFKVNNKDNRQWRRSICFLSIFLTFFTVSNVDFKHVFVWWDCNSSKLSQRSGYFWWHYCAERKIVRSKSFSNIGTECKRVKETLKQHHGQWKHNLFKTKVIKINKHILSISSTHRILHKVAYTIKLTLILYYFSWFYLWNYIHISSKMWL